MGGWRQFVPVIVFATAFSLLRQFGVIRDAGVAYIWMMIAIGVSWLVLGVNGQTGRTSPGRTPGPAGESPLRSASSAGPPG